MKFTSRKFIICSFLIIVGVLFKYLRIIEDWTFIVLILTSSGLYLLVNTALKIETLKINNQFFNINIKEDEDEGK